MDIAVKKRGRPRRAVQGLPEAKRAALDGIIESIKRHGLAAVGKQKLLGYLSGKELSPLSAIKAKCYECSGYMAEGRRDCGGYTCPLYPYMPYRGSHGKQEAKNEEID